MRFGAQGLLCVVEATSEAGTIACLDDVRPHALSACSRQYAAGQLLLQVLVEKLCMGIEAAA